MKSFATLVEINLKFVMSTILLFLLSNYTDISLRCLGVANIFRCCFSLIPVYLVNRNAGTHCVGTHCVAASFYDA